LINHIILLFTSIFIYEFINFFKLFKTVNLNLKIYKKFLNLFKFSKISDFRKQKSILIYSKSLFFTSLKIFIILVFIIILLFLISKLSNSFMSLIVSLYGIIEITFFLLIYHFLRKKINA